MGKKTWLGVLAAIAGVFGTSLAVHAELIGKSAIISDLIYFRDVWAPKDLSFSADARRQMLRFINDNIAHAHAIQRTELALIFAEAQAYSQNDHTYSDYPNEDGLFQALPISFWQFAEGPIVTRAHPQFKHLLGARIVSIGGHIYEDAAKRVDKFIPGTDERRRYLRPCWLSRLEVLQSVGLATEGAVEIEFVMPSGEHRTERLGASPTPDPALTSPTWRASMVPGKGPDPWPHVLDQVSSLPLYVQKPDEMTATRLNDGRVLYIRSNSLSPYEGEITVMLKAYLIMDGIVKSGNIPSDIIVDVRYNGGGNLFNIIDFSKELAQVVGPQGHIYVIEGRATNSAAIAFMALLKSEGAERTTLVGEEASDTPWFWSEGDKLEAPNSKLPLRYTNGYHDWAHGCTDLKKCYWPVVFHGVAAGSLRPDISVEMTFSDYVAGKDPALEAVLTDIKRRG